MEELKTVIENFLVSLSDKSLTNQDLKGSSRLPIEKGLEIYRCNLVMAKLNILEDKYPLSKRVLGNNCFNEVAKKFAVKSHSTQFDINLYASNFPTFIKAAPWFKSVKYIYDLATLECRYYDFVNNNNTKEQQSSNEKLNLLSKEPGEVFITSVSQIDIIESSYPLFDLFKNIKDQDFDSNKLHLNKAQDVLIYNTKEDTYVEQLHDKNLKALFSKIKRGILLTDLVKDLKIKDISNTQSLIKKLISYDWVKFTGK